MSSLEDKLPRHIYKAIIDFIDEICKDAELGSWFSGEEEEDSITGDFFGNLRRLVRTKNNWTWEINYRKSRGRGPRAIEKSIGTDGIFQVSVRNEFDSIVFLKGFLFQAKKGNLNNSVTIQLSKMENLLSGSSCVILYNEDGYKAMKSKKYLNDPDIWETESQDLCDFLINTFFKCKAGLQNLFYDFQTKQIKHRNKVIATTVRNIIRLNITRNN